MKFVVEESIVHLIKTCTNGRSYLAKCGARAQRQTLNEPAPPDMTGWSGDVTCEDCSWEPA